MPGNELAMALTWERGFPATEALDPVVDELLREGAVHVPLIAPVAEDELGLVERSLYQPGRPLRGSGQVRLSEAAGGEAEAFLAAACAASAIADGFEPEQIVVAFRDLAGRRELVGAALRAARVPYAVDLQLEFRATPLGSALIALASVEGGQGGREAMLHFLRGPFSDVDALAVEEIDARWRKYREHDGERLVADAARLTTALSDTVQLVRAVCRAGGTDATAKNWQELTTLMLAAAADGGTRHEGDLRLDVAAHRLLVQASAQMAAAGLAIRGEQLLEGLAKAPVSSGSTERPGTVQVTEVHRIRSRRFDVVILGGLTADEFTSEKREPLAATLLGRMGLSEGMDERPAERMLFYLAVTRATGRLELVRQSADAAGTALRPSVFWEEMRDLYRTPDQTAHGEQGGLAVRRKVSLSDLENAAPTFTDGRTEARAAATQGRLQPPGLGRGRLTRTADLLSGTHEVSVSEIEDYLACPYRWFYTRVIRPSEADRVFDARSRGSYAHALIARFYARFQEQGHRRVDGQNLASALRTLDEAFADMEQSNRWKIRGLREEVAAATARSWVRSAIEQDADMLEGFEPRAHEWAFGTEAGAPFQMGGVGLHGKVDRVDLGPGGVVVTDYKSSSAVHGHAEFQSRRLLQVVVYARAAAAAFDTAPVAGVYRSLSARTLRGFWDTEHAGADPLMRDKDTVGHEQVSQLFSTAQDQIATAADGMRAGRIEPNPADRKACEYCGARRSCREAIR
jgi:RecB family exonuclease